jgi:hypothetical protein
MGNIQSPLVQDSASLNASSQSDTAFSHRRTGNGQPLLSELTSQVPESSYNLRTNNANAFLWTRKLVPDFRALLQTIYKIVLMHIHMGNEYNG